MKSFTQFSETIDRLLGGARCVRITVDGYILGGHPKPASEGGLKTGQSKEARPGR